MFIDNILYRYFTVLFECEVVGVNGVILSKNDVQKSMLLQETIVDFMPLIMASTQKQNILNHDICPQRFNSQKVLMSLSYIFTTSHSHRKPHGLHCLQHQTLPFQISFG